MGEPHARTSALEWISAAIGLALLLLVAAVIGRDALAGDDARPPAITVELRRAVPSGSGFLAEFEAVNASGGTAAAVAIEGVLSVPGRQPETASATLDYVGGKARVAGGLYFQGDVRRGTLALRALGYQQP